jgi:hypothetical protein
VTTCKRCRKQTFTTKEVRTGVFCERCSSCGWKSHKRRDHAVDATPHTIGWILEPCDCER